MKIKGFGFVKVQDNTGFESSIHIHTKDNSIMITSAIISLLTPNQAIAVARKLLNAADYAERVIADE